LIVTLVVSYFLPDRVPDIVLPVVIGVAIRTAADYRFGPVVKQHRAAGGVIASWWRVVGIGVLGLIAMFAVGVLLIVGLMVIGVFTIPR